MESGVNYTLPVDGSFLSSVALGKMPEVYNAVLKRYNKSRDYWAMFDILRGKRKVVTKNLVYTHTENKRHYKKLQVAGTGTVGNVTVNGITRSAATFTVNASSMSTANGRSVSPVAERDLIEIPSTHEVVVVISVNRSANPHTFSVLPMRATVTPANIVAAVASNGFLTNFSSTLSDGGTTGTGIITDYTTYENEVGKIDHAFNITDGLGMEQQWFTLDGKDGKKGKFYYYDLELENYIRFKNKMFYAALFSRRNTANVIDAQNDLGNKYMSTDGMITTVREQGNFNYQIGNLTMTDFESMSKRMLQKEGATENLMLCGQGFELEANRFLVDFYGKCNSYDAFKGGKAQSLEFGFQSIKIGGYNFHLQTCPFFNDPDMFGADEQDFSNAALIMPTDSVMSTTDGRQEAFIFRHTDMKSSGASFYGEDFTKGGGSIDEDGLCAYWASGNPFTDQLRRKQNYVANFGVELFGASRYELFLGN